MNYNDEYPTCAETKATLRIYHDQLDPESVSNQLSLTPTVSQRKGGVPASRWASKPAAIGGWFLSTEGKVISKDCRRHIDWIIESLVGRGDVLRQFREDGCRTEISVYWVSAYGNGGPMVSPHSMARLGVLGLELQFDIYFFEDDTQASDNRSEDSRGSG